MNKIGFFTRFVSCVRSAGLLKKSSEAARFTLTGGTLTLSTVRFVSGGIFKSAVTDTNILNRCEIFRGKISRWKTQTNKKRLEERTLLAPII